MENSKLPSPSFHIGYHFLEETIPVVPSWGSAGQEVPPYGPGCRWLSSLIRIFSCSFFIFFFLGVLVFFCKWRLCQLYLYIRRANAFCGHHVKSLAFLRGFGLVVSPWSFLNPDLSLEWSFGSIFAERFRRQGKVFLGTDTQWLSGQDFYRLSRTYLASDVQWVLLGVVAIKAKLWYDDKLSPIRFFPRLPR